MTKKVEAFHSPSVAATLSDDQVEEIDELAEERGLNRAALLRQLIFAGWRADQELDLELDTDDETLDTTTTDPFKEIFISCLPETENEAVELDELRESIKKEVDDEVMRLFREYEDIGMTGGRIYDCK